MKDSAPLEAVGIRPENVNSFSYAYNRSDYFFQLMFYAATESIVSGTTAERIKSWPFLLFTSILTAIIYLLSTSCACGGGGLERRRIFRLC